MKRKLIYIALSLTALVFCAAATYQGMSKSPVTTLAATNGYSGSTADLAADNAYDYTTGIDLSTGVPEGGPMYIHFAVEYDSSGTTDNIVFSIFASVTGETDEYDDIELYTIEFDDNGGADTQQSVVYNVSGLRYIRAGVKTSVSTTDTFDYQIKYVLSGRKGT